MTPNEILKDLRDIHLPDSATEAAAAGFVFWPIAIVLALLLFALGLIWWRRSTWRREIVRHLDRIEQTAVDGRTREGWTDLAILLRRTAVQLAEREDVAGLIGDSWLKKLDHLFKTDFFSSGPGCGLAVFPYESTVGRSPEERDDAAAALTATINHIRINLTNLRMAR